MKYLVILLIQLAILVVYMGAASIEMKPSTRAPSSGFDYKEPALGPR